MKSNIGRESGARAALRPLTCIIDSSDFCRNHSRMADRGTRKGGTGAEPLERTLEIVVGEPPAVSLPADLPPEMFTGPGLIALADLLPVMTAYCRPRARPSASSTSRMPTGWRCRAGRSSARPCASCSARRPIAARKPLIDAALAGERSSSPPTFDHPTRGHAGAADRLCAVGRAGRASRRRHLSSCSPT